MTMTMTMTMTATFLLCQLLLALSSSVVVEVAAAAAAADANSRKASRKTSRKTSTSSARLRGQNFDALEERARNPDIKDNLRGKTLKDLLLGVGVVEEQDQDRRNAQSESQPQQQDPSSTMKYFSIYDEFGPFFVSMGDTAGLRGMIYNNIAKDNGLDEEFVEGALQGTCSIVASDGKQLCSYEMFLLNPSTGTMGTVVATGSVMMELNTKNILIIEATGDDFVAFQGGMVSITYTAIGGQTVMDLDVTLR